MPRRIVVAADLGIVRKGIVSMLAYDPRLQVIAETEDGAHAMIACRECRPDLLILALWLPQYADLAVTRLLAPDRHAPRILVLGERGDVASVNAALDAGATGFLPATVGHAELCAGVHRVLAGEQLMPELGDHPGMPLVVLGPQEKVILSKVAHGLPNKAIARQQGVSVRTVGNQLQHIFRKLGASNRMEAVTRARQQGLLRNE